MALSPKEEKAFRALAADLGEPRFARWRTAAWATAIVGCLGAIGSADALDSPWLAALGWLGLIAAGLAGVAVPRGGPDGT
jgi:hypothetical protein